MDRRRKQPERERDPNTDERPRPRPPNPEFREGEFDDAPPSGTFRIPRI